MLALAVAVFLAVSGEAPVIGSLDSGLFSFEAARVASGETPYADFETYSSPGPLLIQGAAYRVLGTTVAATHVVHACLQAALAAMIYGIARRLGVRSSIAMVAPLLGFGLGYPAWPWVSLHWFGALGLAAVFFGLSWDWKRISLIGNAGQGALVGVLLWLQFQKGLMLLPVFAGCLLLDAGLPSRELYRTPLLRRRFCAIGAGLVTAVAVLYASTITHAGWLATLDGLIVGPLVRYRRWSGNQNNFALVWVLLPVLIGGLPGSLASIAGRIAAVFGLAVGALIGLAAVALHRRDRRRTRRLVFVGAYVTAALVANGYRLSTWNYQAFVAPAVAIALAFGLEALLTAIERRWSRTLLTGLGISFAAAAALSAWGMIRARSIAYPAHARTHFGNLAVTSIDVARRLEAAIGRMDDLGIRSLYCHTYCPEVNLLYGLPNPTRHEFLLLGINTPEQFLATRELLARRNDLYIATGYLSGFQEDPVRTWILENYTSAARDFPEGLGLPVRVLVRKDLDAPFKARERLRRGAPSPPPPPASTF